MKQCFCTLLRCCLWQRFHRQLYELVAAHKCFAVDREQASLQPNCEAEMEVDARCCANCVSSEVTILLSVACPGNLIQPVWATWRDATRCHCINVMEADV